MMSNPEKIVKKNDNVGCGFSLAQSDYMKRLPYLFSESQSFQSFTEHYFIKFN